MFTGIVEEIGTIRKIDKGVSSCSITVQADKVLHGSQVGDSIAVNGVSLLQMLNASAIGGEISTADWLDFKNNEVSALERLVNNNPLL